MIYGTDGSKYCRILQHFHYEINGRSGMIRNFSGKLFDNERYVGDCINGGIYMADQTWIKIADGKIFTQYGRYELDADVLSSDIVVWFGVQDEWDALRIVLKDINFRKAGR